MDVAQTMPETVVLAVMPSIPLGGMERACIEIFRMLRDHGVRVVVLTQREHGDRVRQACLAHGLETIPVSVSCSLRFPRRPLELFRYFANWYLFIRQIARSCRHIRPNWIFITNVTYFLYSWPILATANCKVIFRLPIPPDSPKGRVRAVVVRWLWRRLITPLCTQIVCNSEFTLGRLLATGARPRSVNIVHNVVPSRKNVSSRFALAREDTRLRVTYIGRLTVNKGIRELFDAAVQIAKERQDVDFYFAGDYQWQNPFARKLIEKTNADGLQDRIIFLGEIDDVLGLLSSSDLHVLFSAEEAFGLTVLEAKSQGVPSIVSPGGALPELITHLEDGYVCRSLTVTALRQGLDYFLNNADRRHQAGMAALKSMQRFETEFIGRQWAAALNLQ